MSEACYHHPTFPGVSLTGEAILNYAGLPRYMAKEGWQRYRIEYGFECSCPETTIYLPPNVDPERIEEIIGSRWVKDDD